MLRKLIATLSVAAMLGTTTFASVAQAGPRHHRVYHGGHKTVVIHKNYGHRRGFRHHRRRGGRGAAIAAGVLGGIVLGSVIANNRRDRYYQPRTVYVPATPPAYVPAPVYQAPQPVYQTQPVSVPPVQPVQAPVPAQRPAYAGVDPTADPFLGAECLQVREYQTTILIGGREQGAYGLACLQPDGSWLQGPAQPDPQW